VSSNLIVQSDVCRRGLEGDSEAHFSRRQNFLDMIVFVSVFLECVAAIAQIFLLCAVGAVMERIVSAMRFSFY
jgi:hypothetical protein